MHPHLWKPPDDDNPWVPSLQRDAIPHPVTLPQCRNKVLIDKYGEDVIAAYAQGFVKDVVMGASLRTAANYLMLAAAQAAHQAEFDRVTAENARVAALHASEVKEKLLKEQQYIKVGAAVQWGERPHARSPLLDVASSPNPRMFCLLSHITTSQPPPGSGAVGALAGAADGEVQGGHGTGQEGAPGDRDEGREGVADPQGGGEQKREGQRGRGALVPGAISHPLIGSIHSLTLPRPLPLLIPLFVADRGPQHQPAQGGRVLACTPAGGRAGGQPQVPGRARGQGQGQEGAWSLRKKHKGQGH